MTYPARQLASIRRFIKENKNYLGAIFLQAELMALAKEATAEKLPTKRGCPPSPLVEGFARAKQKRWRAAGMPQLKPFLRREYEVELGRPLRPDEEKYIDSLRKAIERLGT